MLELTSAPQGFTLEEMDEIFNSGLPPWKTLQKSSRLDQLEAEIKEGKLKVQVPHEDVEATSGPGEKTEEKAAPGAEQV